MNPPDPPRWPNPRLGWIDRDGNDIPPPTQISDDTAAALARIMRGAIDRTAQENAAAEQAS